MPLNGESDRHWPYSTHNPNSKPVADGSRGHFQPPGGQIWSESIERSDSRDISKIAPGDVEVQPFSPMRHIFPAEVPARIVYTRSDIDKPSHQREAAGSGRDLKQAHRRDRGVGTVVHRVEEIASERSPARRLH